MSKKDKEISRLDRANETLISVCTHLLQALRKEGDDREDELVKATRKLSRDYWENKVDCNTDRD
jgi:hypothetical protein